MRTSLKISAFENAIALKIGCANKGYIYFTSYSQVGNEIILRNGLHVSARINLTNRQIRTFKEVTDKLIVELRTRNEED